MIAEPDSSITPPTDGSSPREVDENPLSDHELYQLTLYKWRYSLEAFGFEQHEIRELMFVKWLHASRRVAP